MRTSQNDTSFQTWQAVADLAHHIKPLLTLHLGGVAQAMGVGPREAGVAVGLLRDDGFAFRREATQGLREGLQAIAISRAAGFDLAVVVLLADLLQSRVKSPLLADVWPEAVTRLRLWPDTVRAAVAQGLMRARDLGLAEIAPLAPARGITRGAKEIAEHLLQIIRSMRREELQAVAHVDQGRG